ncbi:Peptidase [Oryctes borbonicus]|uniref:Peptidase n=1 Tax=Oryctes borbonicus TaxID=1629725 RepID=A0A0T6B2K6_9SCAR|nr:Peptidase [Oryctes borbonicus]
MKRYGYLPPDTDTSAALYSEEGLSNVIIEIQKFGAIPQTGKLDNATLQLMSAPRCGVPDIQHKRSKRYTIVSKGWSRRNITYYVANWPYTVGEHKTKKDIKLALTTWGKYGRLRFEEVDGSHADIIIAFAREYHGDSFPFDGQGNILAHAFFPNEYLNFAGDVHFDADEDWTKEPSDEGIYFYAVALHELGHSLGLAHSAVASSIMFPYYKYDTSNLNLDYDDILGIYELYIRSGPIDDYPYIPETDDSHWTSTARTINPYTTPSYFPTTESNEVIHEEDVETIRNQGTDITTLSTPTTDSSHLPDICEGNFDAAAMLREELFIFKDKYVWRLKEKNIIEENYPVPIKQMFPKLPSRVGRIDAAYERPDGMIIIFSGKEVWIYDGYEFVENSPQPLSSYGLPNNLDKIDAAQIWDKNV